MTADKEREGNHRVEFWEQRIRTKKQGQSHRVRLLLLTDRSNYWIVAPRRLWQGVGVAN